MITVGPVRLTADSRVAYAPATRASITGGFWADRRRVNREVTIPAGWHRLLEAGNFVNLEAAAERTLRQAQGAAERSLSLSKGPTDERTLSLSKGPTAIRTDLPFLDSDVHKWLESVGWTLADPELSAEASEQLRARAGEAIELLARAQEPDGYLQSHFQLTDPGSRFAHLSWGHELYVAGHLIQGAIALARAGDDRLLAIARRYADLVVASFGPGLIESTDGHPEIETALVELYRETGDRSYLDAATFHVNQRGRGTVGRGHFGPQYWQDRVPIRESTAVEGHAVRQLYLLAGVADLYTESGEDELLTTAVRLWEEMAATRTYLTGAIGTHHRDEAFGDPYELTNERSYGETCAAIASLMFSWRLLLITGEARYADSMERTLYNGILAGLSLDGQRYLYANPLQIREGHVDQGNEQDYHRQAWFPCACCPPNVMRLLASLPHYAVVGALDELLIHQYVPGAFTAGPASVEVSTDYPWDGLVRVTVTESADAPWTLGLRVPHWAETATLTVKGEDVARAATPAGNPTSSQADGWLRITRQWQAGDVAELELPLIPRFTRADPRVDADRGLVALERGPLVYCVEAADQPGLRLDDVVVDITGRPTVGRPMPELAEAYSLHLRAATRRRRPQSWWPYRDAAEPEPEDDGETVALTAIPYYAWGNRTPGTMRVWLREG